MVTVRPSFTITRLRSLPTFRGLAPCREGRKAWVPGLSDYDLTLLTERFDTPRTIRVLEEPRARSGKSRRPCHNRETGSHELRNTPIFSLGPCRLHRSNAPIGSLFGQAAPRSGRFSERPVSRENEFLLDALSRYISFFFLGFAIRATLALAKSRAY
jgi:hypothetical protein